MRGRPGTIGAPSHILAPEGRAVAAEGAPIAILGAMPEEIEALLGLLEDRSDERVGGFELHRGRLEGWPVVLAHCGIGKVNAAALTQVLTMTAPAALIFTGVAGAAGSGLSVGDLVVARSAVQHDVDVTALGYALGTVPGEPPCWNCDEGLVALALESASAIVEARVVAGVVASGDQFIADRRRTEEIRERFGGTCVEMEGAAVAQVCAKARLPFVIIRSISDSADSEADMSFREFTALAAGRAKQLVREMLRRL